MQLHNHESCSDLQLQITFVQPNMHPFGMTKCMPTNLTELNVHLTSHMHGMHACEPDQYEPANKFLYIHTYHQ